MEGGEEGSLTTGEDSPWKIIGKVEEESHENHEERSEETEEKKLQEDKADSQPSGSKNQKKDVSLTQKKSADIKGARPQEKVCPADEKMKDQEDTGPECPEAEPSGGASGGADRTEQQKDHEYQIPPTVPSFDALSLDAILNSENEDMRTQEEYDEVIKALDAIVALHNINKGFTVHMACSQIGQVPSATEKEQLLYMKKILPANANPRSYGFPFTKAEAFESEKDGEHLPRTLNPEMQELENWFRQKFAGIFPERLCHPGNKPLYEMREDAEETLKGMVDPQNPRLVILRCCMNGALAEEHMKDARKMNTLDATAIRDRLARTEYHTMKEILILMMNFPILSKLHRNVVLAAAHASIRDNATGSNNRHNLDSEFLGTTFLERQLYIPGFVSAYFDLMTDLIVDLCANAAKEGIESRKMSTVKALRAQQGIPLQVQQDLHKEIRAEQVKFYKMIVGELLGSDVLGTPGNLGDLLNQNVMQTVRVKHGKDKMVFITPERAHGSQQFEIASLDRQDFHPVYAAALFGMMQMEYSPEVTKKLVGGRKFVFELDKIGERLRDLKTSGSNTVMNNLEHIGRFAMEIWLDLGDLATDNMRAPGVAEGLKRKLWRSDDYEDMIDDIIALSQGKTVQSKITNWKISLEEEIQNHRLIPQEGQHPRKPIDPRQVGGRGGDRAPVTGRSDGPGHVNPNRHSGPGHYHTQPYRPENTSFSHEYHGGQPMYPAEPPDLYTGLPPRQGGRGGGYTGPPPGRGGRGGYGGNQYGARTGREKNPYLENSKVCQDIPRSDSSNSSIMESDDYFKLRDHEDSANQSEGSDVIHPRCMRRPQELTMERTRRSESERTEDGVSVWIRPSGSAKAKKNARSRLGNEPQTGGRFAVLGDGTS